jgi:hypothetical protein
VRDEAVDDICKSNGVDADQYRHAVGRPREPMPEWGQSSEA